MRFRRPKGTCAIAVLGPLLLPAAAAPGQDLDALLARGDTTAAIETLRAEGKRRSPARSCLLATLLTHRATSATSTWRLRAEAVELFNQALREDPTPLCYVAYATLREKQGSRMEADRMLRRAEALLRERPELRDVDLEVALLYRRALVLDDWLRNFDYLINAQQLVVSTPGCIYYGYFCENFSNPVDFNARLAAAPSAAGVVADQRVAVVRWLDSALALRPRHLEARRLLLRRALVEERWEEFEAAARAGIAADSGAVLPWLALLAARERRGAYGEATAALQRLDALVPDGVRTEFERLAVITRDADLGRADALWRLSDPLYLTATNERRVQHYARIALADIAFTDPGLGLAGRDTEAGRLVLRYGWPRAIWDVRRDGRLELDPQQMRILFEIIACMDVGCAIAAERQAQKGSSETYGRWTFFNYDVAMPSFIFERNLAARTMHYKLVTLTEQLDSNLARVAPSTYDSPYEPGVVSALLTRFPRPRQPVVEVAARFSWAPGNAAADSVAVGLFVHERLAGQLVNHGTSTHWARDSVRFVSRLAVVPGALRLAIEGHVPERSIAGALRTEFEVPRPDPGVFVSDLLLGMRVEGPHEATRREAVRVVHRTDSLPGPGDTLALYWEVYGLGVGTDSVQRYDIEVEMLDAAGGRPPGAELVRVFANVLGLRRGEVRYAWRRERRALPEYVPEFVELRLPTAPGSYRFTIRVVDALSGASGACSRVITVRESKAR